MNFADLLPVAFVLTTISLLYHVARRGLRGNTALYRNQPGWQLQGLCIALASHSGVPVGLVRLIALVLFVCAPTPVFVTYLLGSLCIPWNRPLPASS